MIGANLGGALELVRPWLSTGAILGLLTLAIKWYVENRRLRLAEKTREQDFQLKVSDDGRSNLQFVIDNLVRDITAQREATAKVAADHKHCERELLSVRRDYRNQERKLDGLSRQFLAFSESVGRAIPPGTWTPEVANMMDKLESLAAAARGTVNEEVVKPRRGQG